MFRNIKIESRLALGFSIVLVITVAVIGVSLHQVQVSNEKFERIVTVNNVRIQLANNMIDNAREAAIDVRNIIIVTHKTESGESIQEIRDHLAEVGRRYAESAASVKKLISEDDKEGFDLLSKIEASGTAARQLQDQVIELAVAGKHIEGIDLMTGKACPTVKQWISETDNFIRHNEERTALRYNEAKKSAYLARTTMFILGTAAIVLSVAIFIFLYLSVIERKKTEEFRAALLYARNLIEASLDPLVTISADGKIMDVNEATVKVTGVSRERLIGSDFADYFTEPEKARAGYEQVFLQGIVRNYPLTIRHTSGRTTDVLYNASVYKNEAGEVQGVFASARDITERKWAEEELYQRKERFRIAAESISNLIWEWDILKGTLTWFGDIDSALGYGKEEFPRTIEAWEKTIHPDDHDRVMALLDKHIRDKTPYSTEYRVIKKNGSIVFWVDKGTALWEENGQAYRMVGAIADITDRKRAEEAMRTSEIRYRLLFESAKDGILILDAETGMIADVNPFLVEMLGFSHEQFVGKTIWEIGLFKDIASNKNKFLELQRQEYVRYENLPLETADGRRIEVEFVSNVYLVDHKKVIQCNIRDITERKRAEREMEEKQREMIKMKLEFISMVSHELRTPLTVIKEGITLVTDGSTGEINEEQKEILGLSKKNVDRLAKLINDVLDFQKLEAGKIKIDAQPNDINEIVRSVYEMMTLAAKDKGVDVLLELDDRLPRAGFDNDKITQVLTNLVDNAMKFTEKGNIVIKTSKKNEMIHVSVSDTGCGIKKKDLSRLFGRFEQLSTGGERKTGGTGLGLAICKGIIERHNGKIWVDSVFGKGTKFTFALPVYGAKGPLKNHINDEMREASKNGTKMSILLISMSDLDKLKQKLPNEKINSTLKDMEALLDNSVRHGPHRATDAVFKLSGEVFVVLANCDKEGTLGVKERLEQKLDDYLSQQKLNDKVRLLSGCATYPDDANTDEDLIMKAKELHPVVSTALSV